MYRVVLVNYMTRIHQKKKPILLIEDKTTRAYGTINRGSIWSGSTYMFRCWYSIKSMDTTTVFTDWLPTRTMAKEAHTAIACLIGYKN